MLVSDYQLDGKNKPIVQGFIRIDITPLNNRCTRSGPMPIADSDICYRSDRVSASIEQGIGHLSESEAGTFLHPRHGDCTSLLTAVLYPMAMLLLSSSLELHSITTAISRSGLTFLSFSV